VDQPPLEKIGPCAYDSQWRHVCWMANFT